MPARNDDLREALRRAASALRARGPDFALAGSYALWVFGGPEPVHDVDFVVAEPDADDLEEQELLVLGRDEVETALLAGEFKVVSWATVVALTLVALDRR